MRRIATISPVWGCSVEELRALAREAEAAEFEGIFSPEVPPYSAISNAQIFAEATSNIKVGTWIANIYMRQPVMCAAEALTVQEVSGGRMILGLGVSHKPVNERFGINMGDPIEEMRKYVTAVRSFVDGSSPLLTVKRDLQPIPIYIAGLTEKTAELAGEVADGLMSYLATPEYVTKLVNAARNGAKKAGRFSDNVNITNGIPCFISDDLEAARKAARRALAGYARFPFYQRMIKNTGFGDIVEKIKSGVNPQDAFTDEFLDTVALLGPADRCRQKLEAFRGAGLRLPIIVPNPVGKQSNVEVMKNMIQALADY
jgi:alkanesulfonate monooxygenase SsuD/methylene tetrahydromethanopterin reductase-like flavin-dependent oxidoreductase (luciferase family)